MSSPDAKRIPIPVGTFYPEGHLIAGGQWLVRMLPDPPPGHRTWWVVLTTQAQYLLISEQHNDPVFVELSVFDRLADLAGWPGVPGSVVTAAEKKLAELEIRRDLARDFTPPDPKE